MNRSEKSNRSTDSINPAEYNQIVHRCTTTTNESATDKTIYQLFKEQVQKNPNTVAIVYKEQKLTYLELYEKSNQLARHIRLSYEKRTKRSLTPDTLIALYLDRSLELVIGILAVLKAGAAYVPIDPFYPQERVNYLLNDIQTDLIIRQKHLLNNNNISLPQDKIIYIDLTEKLYIKQPKSDFPSYNKPNDLAYVIYTSGTTGKPKGVMIEQRSVINLISDLLIRYRIESSERFLLFANYAFDASCEQLFISLFSGGTLFIIDNESIFDTKKFIDFIVTNAITHLHATPSYLSSVPPSQLTTLKRVIFGAEYLSKELFTNYTKHIPVVINEYGPTETTITSLVSINSYLLNGATIQNTSAYILDINMLPAEIGAIGELYIGGACLARGYFNQPVLTAACFISNPFATDIDIAKGYNRLYKTGDLMRWLPDGNIEYIGRNDDQVKIRGFRIELGEVANMLSQIKGIRQSCVIVKERDTAIGNNNYLVGYYIVNHGNENLTPSVIQEKLKQKLPEHLVPDILVEMKSFPLTSNGKLDKQSLPDPFCTIPSEEYHAPSNETERIICKIWEESLIIDKIGLNDNFFRLGGNSILAIQVSHQMSKALGSDIKVADIFKYKSISQLLIHCSNKIEIIIPQIDKNQAVLSFAQDRLWFIEQYEKGTNAYHIPEIYQLDSTVNIEGISYAIQQIVKRHEALRTTIDQLDDQGQGIQKVQNDPLSIEQIMIPDRENMERCIKKDINRPFNLTKEYPIRVIFYHIQSHFPSPAHLPNETFLLINMHHIASDGWSIDIFQKELYMYYEAYVKKDNTFCLPKLQIQYKDYAVWQKTYLEGPVLEKQLNYWKSKLSDYQSLELSTDFARPTKIDYTGGQLEFKFNKEVSKKLRELAKHLEVTLHTVMLSSMNILLSKYTGQDDIITGSVIANRHYRQTEELIGFFANTQVNRTLLSSSQSYEDLIRQVHREQIESQLHQDLSFEKLVDEMKVERDISRHPIFQVLFVVQSFGNKYKTGAQQKEYLKPFKIKNAFAVEKFDLSVFIDDRGEELSGQISYALCLFKKETINRFIDHFSYLLHKLTESPSSPYSQISLLRPLEYNQLIYDRNTTERDYPANKTLYQLFQEQVKKSPEALALVFEGQELTYRELNEKSNKLARHIRSYYTDRTKKKLVANTMIALYLDRSLEMVISILAVLKSGGAYVPMDISYPQERIDHLLEDTKTELIISQRYLNVNNPIKLPTGKMIFIDLTEPFYEREDKEDLPVYSQATDLAYVIYTSGTTGKPKGVKLDHRAISNTVNALYSVYDIKTIKKTTAYTSYVFDVSVSELFAALLQGLELHILASSIRTDCIALSNYFAENEINLVYLPPVILSQLPKEIAPSLHSIIYAGEPCDKQTAAYWSTKVKLFNYYGPTEAGIYATGKQILTDEVEQIGIPIQNNKVYVLDKYHNPVPIGVVGELYLGGAGLATGYLNRPELTAERFVFNPFATLSDKEKGYTRLYKTGDLVRWLPNGNLEYTGRNDDQIKIHGYRVELAEIEYALTQLKGIKQSCVIVKERKTETGTYKYLVGYYVLDGSYISENDSAILDSWENLYDSEYEKATTEINVASDFSGWNSYITSEAIPLNEMQEWRTNIIGSIKKLNPRSILEVGVGSGLLMFPLLNDVRQYVGLDISRSVVNRHINYFKDKNYNVKFFHLKADQLDELPADELYDTIIINSVCQYFPSIYYFDNMLEKAIGKLSKNGSIFLGDIRNFDLQKELIREKLIYKGENFTQQDIDRIALKESELLISPNYFIDLKNKFKNLKIEVLKRSNCFKNELNKYRFDVIVSIQGHNTKITKKDTNTFLTGRHNYHNTPYLNQLNKEDIIRQLSIALPSYMIPGILVALESFPLTLNGKLDKRMLPDPDSSLSNEVYQAPVTETETKLCKIWQQVLGLERVGTTDNFFQIGGNSIIAIQVSHQMSKIMESDIKVADVFSQKTIKALIEKTALADVEVEGIEWEF